ncbi:MAG: 50S ribosomal protein L24 [Candidatus Woesearchaeota archaeon]|nr:50S ribosomal protein L24 [Candidatus Woesearchaeota archaeon]
MRSKFSANWNSSIKARKQRKFRHNAPLHIKRRFLSSPLSKELRKKYGKRNIIVRKGDKVKITRGKFNEKNGSVEEVSIRKSRIYVTGAEFTKKDGTKARVALDASKVMITELNLSDKKRKEILERKNE